jgi:adenine phosphoribosyltransferase
MAEDARVQRIRGSIRDIPDFPKPGILFKDITPLLGDGPIFRDVIQLFAERYRDAKLTRVVAVESRGFLFGAALAAVLGVGVVPIRKPGKLPHKRRSITYSLEYGEDTLEIHVDGVGKEDRVVVLDDVLATGGTAQAARDLVAGCGAEVLECAFLMELSFLPGRERLRPTEVFSILTY